MMDKRYFIVFYAAEFDGMGLIGNLPIERTGDEFVNNLVVSELIRKECQLGEDTAISITNIKELSEKDYKHFIREE